MKHRTILIIVAVALGGMLTGCAAQNENKPTAAQQWESTLAGRRLAEVENLIDRGRLDEAKQTLQRSLAAEPELAQAHYLMGRVHFQEDRAHEAQAAFERALELDAALDAAWYHLGILAFWDDDFDAALEAYQTAMTLKPGNIEYAVTVVQLYVHTEQYDRAEALLEQRLRRQPRNRDLLIAKAELHQRLGQLDQTAFYYDQILLSNPDDTQVLEALGYCFAAQGRWAQAADVFDRMLELVEEPAYRESILSTLGQCALNAGRFSQALSTYDRLSTLRRNDPEVWLNMAQAALGVNRIDRAADNAQRALSLRPGWTQGYAVLGSAQFMQGRYNEALRSFAHLRSDKELSGYGWFMTGRCYAQLGQTAKAEAAFEQAGADSTMVLRFLKDDDRSL